LRAKTEYVVLVNDEGSPIGTADKALVHTTETALHLAFSCHLYDSRGRVLVTRRSLEKLTWPGVWTNSFCGHPAPGESMEDAIARRAEIELGVTVTGISPLLTDFRYRAVDATGIVENEICPVFAAVTDDELNPNPAEVSEWEWVEPDDLRRSVSAAPFAFSPWLGWQLERLESPVARSA
jgi:isopentenyl-diphosphate delta-isomerase